MRQARQVIFSNKLVAYYFWFNGKTNYIKHSNTKIKPEKWYSNKTIYATTCKKLKHWNISKH